MAEAAQDSELGRSKQAVTPREHLLHLLSIGWDTNSPLIQKYVKDNGLERVLDEYKRQSET